LALNSQLDKPRGKSLKDQYCFVTARELMGLYRKFYPKVKTKNEPRKGRMILHSKIKRIKAVGGTKEGNSCKIITARMAPFMAESFAGGRKSGEYPIWHKITKEATKVKEKVLMSAKSAILRTDRKVSGDQEGHEDAQNATHLGIVSFFLENDLWGFSKSGN
jgi:hypothetical protein